MMKPPLAASSIRHRHHLLAWTLLSLCLARDMLVNGWSSVGLLHPSSSMSSPLQAGWILPTPRSKIQKKRSSKLENRNFPAKRQTTGSQSPLLFEITDNDQEYQIAMDVPGVKREDIHVDLLLDDAGAVALSISGLRRLHKKQAGKVVKEFSQSFALDPAVVAVDQLTANLENGVLTVSAPKDMMKESNKRLQEKIRQQIPVQVPTEKGDDDSHADDGGGAFDARNESSDFKQADPMKEEEEDLNAA